MLQLTITNAIAQGAHGMALSTAKAQLQGFDTEQARAFVLAHLAKHGPTPREDLVEAADRTGRAELFALDQRAWGSVFKTLAGRHQIRCLRADLPRKRGRGTSGGRLWAVFQ